MKDNTGWAILGILFMIFVMIFIGPLWWLVAGYLIGWITKVTVGGMCVTALNTLFGTSITADMLPWIGAGLAWIGSFFKTPSRNLKSK